MSREKVGMVTDEEKEQVLKLYERRIALKELLMTVNNPGMSHEKTEQLYEKIVADTGRTSVIFDKWWRDMAKKYMWESAPNGQWNIDFDTNEIYLESGN
jgi:CXXX repeat modification system protein